MKFSKISIQVLAAMAAVAFLQSCSEDEHYDVVGNKDNLVYVDMHKSNVTEATLYRTPVGVYGESSATIPVCVQYAIEGSDITVSADADTTLVSNYNSEHNTSYLSMPDDVLRSLAITPAKIDKGTKAASTNLTVNIPPSACVTLTGNDYVLPLKLSVASGKGDADRKLAASKTNSVAYMVVHMSNELAYVSGNATATTSVVNTPAGIFGGIDGTFNIALHRAVDSDVKVSAEIDNSLVNIYNSDNNTSYKALPSDVASALVIDGGTVTAGETATMLKVSGNKNLAAKLKDNGYVIPLRITTTYSNGTMVKSDKSVAYLVLTLKESYINDKPSALLGTQQNDVSAWKCIEANNFDKNTFKANDYWKPSASKISSGSFVIDLGSKHKVSSLSDIKNELVKSYKVLLSEDGNKWADIGDVNNCGKFAVGDGWSNSVNWIVLYGGIQTRYVKYEIVFDPNSWVWSYFDETWADSYVGINVQLAFDE